jgi:hypothetical protein
VGASALAANTSGANLTGAGYQALGNITGSNNTAYGSIAMKGTSGSTGTDNSAFGYGALFLLTTGVGNSAFGGLAGSYTTLNSVTSGSYNVGVGNGALGQNTTASNNTAVGYQAGYTNSTGIANTFTGYQAGYTSNASSVNGYNTATGYQAGKGLTTGNNNSFFGFGSGELITTGGKNSILGAYNGNQGGLDIRTASNNIVLSDGDGNPAAYRVGSNGQWWFGLGGTTAGSYEGAMILNGAATSGRGAALIGQSNGASAWAAGSYSYVVSGTSTFFTVANSGGGGVYLNGASATSWTAVSDETRKVIIEPITDAANKVSTLRAVIGRLKTDDETVRRPYLIAQDVQAVLPEAVSESEDKQGAVLGLSYTEVIPLLVAAIKELKAEVDSLKAQINGASA